MERLRFLGIDFEPSRSADSLVQFYRPNAIWQQKLSEVTIAVVERDIENLEATHPELKRWNAHIEVLDHDYHIGQVDTIEELEQLVIEQLREILDETTIVQHQIKFGLGIV